MAKPIIVLALLIAVGIGAVLGNYIMTPPPDQPAPLPMPSHVQPLTPPPTPPTPPALKSAASAGAMTQERLVAFIRAIDPGATGSATSLRFVFEGKKMACVSDSANNRMRLFAPIRPADQIESGHRIAMLGANYHLTLDARYAIGDGIVYALYVHPLDSLRENQLTEALGQVAELVRNFNSSYAATDLEFGGR